MHPSTDEHAHRTMRLISVAAATAIALSSGTNYAYSAWGPQYAARLQLSATQQNLIGNAGNIGMYAIGIPGGILIDSQGPRWGALLGCVGLATGYFCLSGAYEAGPGSTSVPVLCLFALMTGMGSATAFSAALKVCATNWPRHRGTATAFPLSAFGLSAFFWTTSAAVIFSDLTSGYLKLLAWGTTTLVFVGMCFLQIVRPNSSPFSALPTDDHPGTSRRDSSRMHRSPASHKPHIPPSEERLSTETSSLVSSPSTSSGPGDISSDHKSHPNHPHHSSAHPHITGLQLFRTPQFWHLFILLSLLCGVGLMTINNIGNCSLTLSRHSLPHLPPSAIQTRQLQHVAILSLCQFLGRLASGIGSDHLIHHGHSRFWTLVISALLFTIAQVAALNIENPINLFWLSALTGLAYGALFGVYPALVADAFGPEGMGINWGCITLAPVLSGNLFNLAFGAILDGNSRRSSDGHGVEGRVCELGRRCYAGAYGITLMASLGGAGWSLWCIRMERARRIAAAVAATGDGRAHEP